MLAQERRNLILEQLQNEKSVVVAKLSQVYSVSEETIRRDLEKLENDGFATKSYGGAVLNENINIEMPFNIRKKNNIEEKQIIASIVETLIEDGERIMLDASSTAVFIAKAIKGKKNLTVISNSLEIMVELSEVAGWKIISPGGHIREGYLALIGPSILKKLKSYYVDKAFISCSGLDISNGITDGNEDFAEIKHTMLKCAKKKYLVVNSSKLNTKAFVKVCNLADIDGIIIDKQPSNKWMDFFEAHNIICYYPK